MSGLKKIEITANGDRTQATVKLYNETHTMGNALRYILARNPETDFVGYSIPHPGENYLNLRLQTHTMPVERMLKQSLNTLTDVSDAILEEFESELAQFKKEQNRMK